MGLLDSNLSVYRNALTTLEEPPRIKPMPSTPFRWIEGPSFYLVPRVLAAGLQLEDMKTSTRIATQQSTSNTSLSHHDFAIAVCLKSAVRISSCIKRNQRPSRSHWGRPSIPLNFLLFSSCRCSGRIASADLASESTLDVLAALAAAEKYQHAERLLDVDCNNH
ncbi:hypothetical protein PLICRDRAFT_508005 [Plicaturopsis crispa FD-325 SS-3]|nr:hypothetical protein PLICRDRAFT_508005 [Plicaturopsis crispa FD-325 SS-3]